MLIMFSSLPTRLIASIQLMTCLCALFIAQAVSAASSDTATKHAASSRTLTKCGPDGLLIADTSADYPPFEYVKDGQVVGFDIDLAKMIAKKLGCKLEIRDMHLASIISSLQTGRGDFGISGLTATAERKKNVDFSVRYYTPKLAMLFNKKNPINGPEDIAGKAIGAQLGTTMEALLREQLKSGKEFKLVIWSKTPVMVKELELERLQGVLVEEAQAKVYEAMSPNIGYSVFPADENSVGYAIAFPKGSPLKKEFDAVIRRLIKSGAMKDLARAWFAGSYQPTTQP